MFDKCLFVLRNLSSLLERLCALRSRVFDRFFEAAEIAKFTSRYNPQNEMFRLLGTKRSFSQNETFFFSHPYPALFRLISHF